MPGYVVVFGETESVSSGQTSSSMTVLSGGTLDILSGGTVVSTTVLGSETILGTGRQTTVYNGASQTVSYGGLALGTTVQSGGSLIVSAGGTATSAVVDGFDGATVLSGGTISNSYVSGVGTNTLVISGGLAVGTTVGGGAMVVSGVISTTYGANLNDDISTVLTAAFAIGTVIRAGELDVDFGGSTTGTIVLSSASPYGHPSEFVDGGTATGTLVESGAVQEIFSGTAVRTDVMSGGLLGMITGGVASNAVVIAGGTVSGAGGTLVYSEEVDVTSNFAGNLVGSMTVVQSGPGTLALAGTLDSFSGMVVISGGTFELASVGSGGSASINFATSAGVLQIDSTTGLGNTISGFAPGDLIDLAGLGYVGTAAPQVQGNTVTVSEGSLTETLLLAGASFRSFRLIDDGTGGTGLQIACYAAGTRISTVCGDVPVDELAIGDEVITGSGAAEAIHWIGRRSYAGRFLAGKKHLLPVRIRAGALGGGLPRRDLLVSPSHAMFLDGVLVPAACLVNGMSIVQEQHRKRIDYVHIELARHGVILAEGAQSESFLDDDSRGMFRNAAEYAALYPDAPEPGPFCAPRVSDGYQLEAIRRRLATVAEQIALVA